MKHCYHHLSTELVRLPNAVTPCAPPCFPADKTDSCPVADVGSPLLLPQMCNSWSHQNKLPACFFVTRRSGDERRKKSTLCCATPPPPVFTLCTKHMYAPRFWQVVEAALTTALTDRPYSKPLAVYGGHGSHVAPGQGGGAVATATGPHGGGGGMMDGGALDGTLLDGEMDEDGLAEVDFRDQYDEEA